MATGKIRSLDDAGGGTIGAKGLTFAFSAADVAAGYRPSAGDKVSFEREDHRAHDVRLHVPDDSGAPPDGPAPPAGASGVQPRRRVGERRSPPASPPGPGRPPVPPFGDRQRPRPGPAGPERPAPAIPRPEAPEPGEAFVNPYNFVPFRAGGVTRTAVAGASDHLDLRGVTFRLDVTLTFETVASVSPVPAGTTSDGVARTEVRRDGAGHAWIPGSSLKGAFRTVAEALSSSCLSVFDGDASFSWRPIIPSEPGFLRCHRDGGGKAWTIEPATDIRILPRPNERPWSGKAWSGRAQDRGRAKLALWYAADTGVAFTGEWVISGTATGKKWHRIFARSDKAESIAVPEVVVRAADAAHQARRQEDEEKVEAARQAGRQEHEAKVEASDGRRGPGPEAGSGSWLEEHLQGTTAFRRPLGRYMDMSPSEELPVWFRRGVGGVVTDFGPAGLMRTAIRTPSQGEPLRLGEILQRSAPGAHTFAPCSEREDGPVALCPACRLFGTTTLGARASGWRGRVRFGTARTAARLPPGATVTLRPVGRPHPSAQTFYLWDPDRLDEATAAAYANSGARLRGRKFYWHRPGTGASEVSIPHRQKDEIAKRGAMARQLRATELIPRGTTFTFSVIGERLTEAEAGLVVLALEPERLRPAAERTGRLRHKLGGGKGLGMGTAAVRIDGAVVVDPDARYLRPLQGGDTSRLTSGMLDAQLDRWVAAATSSLGLDPSQPDLAALLTILVPTVVDPKLFSYPPGPPGREWESFKWFVLHASKDRATGRPAVLVARDRTRTEPDPLRTIDELGEGKFQRK